MNGLMKKLNESPEELSPSKRKNDSLNLKSICASLYSMDINDEISDCPTKITNPPPAPSSFISRVNLFNKFRQPSNQHQHEYFPIKILTCALNKVVVHSQIDLQNYLKVKAYKINIHMRKFLRDMRFPRDFEFKEVHARYSLILVWYLKKNNILVKCIRSFKPLIEKVYFLAEFAATETNSFESSKDIIKKQAQIFNPEVVDTETACVDAWNGPDIVKCSCSFDENLTSSKHRREMRKCLRCTGWSDGGSTRRGGRGWRGSRIRVAENIS
ncbi:CLUMA_CG003042, isoform A [Clunio marinus]|uniref:CLUMA_CG003042, isoform A n=1 Tax=Clunio marinus TaxID=568069 RepID=A0A1J1HMV8_9DIPT|nr:CLUMA_CG003042, isoform A [Clunio marinus]